MKTKETAMKKIVKFLPAFDKRNEDPNKNYGIGGKPHKRSADYGPGNTRKCSQDMYGRSNQSSCGAGAYYGVCLTIPDQFYTKHNRGIAFISYGKGRAFTFNKKFICVDNFYTKT